MGSPQSKFDVQLEVILRFAPSVMEGVFCVYYELGRVFRNFSTDWLCSVEVPRIRKSLTKTAFHKILLVPGGLNQ